MGIDTGIRDCVWGALDCSEKPAVCIRLAGRKSEDLQRKARPEATPLSESEFTEFDNCPDAKPIKQSLVYLAQV